MRHPDHRHHGRVGTAASRKKVPFPARRRPRTAPRLEKLLGANLLWFGRVLDKQFEVLLARRETGLTPAQARIILRLHYMGPLPQHELADLTGVAAPTLGRTIERMQQQGLVFRRRNPDDRRQVVVELAPAGRERVPPLFDLLQEAEGWLTTGLTARQVARLVGDLSAVRERLKAHAPSRGNGSNGITPRTKAGSRIAAGE